jgi:peroxiredoxin Q/BCP
MSTLSTHGYILGTTLGYYRRSLFVVDATGVVTYAHRSVTSMTFRPTDEIVEAVRQAG